MMRQFGKILKFELKNYLYNKIFIGVTVFLVLAISAVMFFPRIAGLFNDGESDGGDSYEDLPIMLIVSDNTQYASVLYEGFSAAFPEYQIVLSDKSTDLIKQEIVDETASCAFVLNGLTSYTYYVNNLSMYDTNTAVANEVLQGIYRMSEMINGGLSQEDAQSILSAQISYQTENLGVDQMENFFYTYIMIFALYMVILLYGQMVATSVATEKSSRAMEVLITSANPLSMMFGKVFAACLAGLAQLIAVFGSALVLYQMNASYWGNNPIVESIFNMPFELFAYMLIFFILGFFIYAFLYGAIGSTASKLEDINTSVMPITFLFIIGFMVAMFSMTSGDVNNVLMQICSFVPFTSPMVMFTRIAMSTVAIHEIVISIAVLVISVFGIGFIAAKIYRIGVLLYGTPPKISAILNAIRKA